MSLRSFVRAAGVAGLVVLGGASAALAQTGQDAPKPGPPWFVWLGVGTLALGGITLLAVLAGYLIQAPGFRRSGERRAGGE